MNRPMPTMPNPGVPEKRGARPPEWPLEAHPAWWRRIARNIADWWTS